VRSLKVSYKKLWKLLIDREINKKTLASMANISGATITKLAKCESVNMEMLVRICTALKCDLHDIVEIVPDDADTDCEHPRS
jgi:DNA-binding Xre family transcriptional regulator